MQEENNQGWSCGTAAHPKQTDPAFGAHRGETEQQSTQGAQQQPQA